MGARASSTVPVESTPAQRMHACISPQLRARATRLSKCCPVAPPTISKASHAFEQHLSLLSAARKPLQTCRAHAACI